MAGQEVQGMLIRLEATTAQLRQEMARADSTVAQVSGRIDRQLSTVDSAFTRAGQSALSAGSMVRGAMAAVAGGMSISSLVAQADAYAQIASRLRLVTSSAAEFNAAQKAVFSIAQSSYQPLTATAELYQRIATNQRELKLTGEGVAGIVGTISKTMAISGASAESANAALIQLGQAFASGVLRGEELNSVMEQAPALAQAIAAGMGKTVGELRTLGAAGLLTADSVVKALQNQQKAVDDLYSKTSVTIGNSITAIGNSYTQLIGRIDQAGNASARVAEVIVDVSKSIDTFTSNSAAVEETLARVSNVVEALAVIIGARLSVSIGQAVIGFAAATKAAILQAHAAERAVLATDAQLKADAAAAAQALASAQAKQADTRAALARANADVAAAEQKIAADRLRQQSEINNLKSVQATLVGERLLEEQRLAAQISEQGRAAARNRMAEARLAEVAIIRQVQAAETQLAATTVATSTEIQAAYAARTAAALAHGETTTAVNAALITSERAAAAATVASRSMTALSAVGTSLLRLMTGPVGLIAMTGAVAYSFFSLSENSGELKKRLGDLADPTEQLTERFERLNRATQAVTLRELRSQIEDTQSQIAQMSGAMADKFESDMRGMGAAGAEGLMAGLSSMPADTQAALDLVRKASKDQAAGIVVDWKAVADQLRKMPGVTEEMARGLEESQGAVTDLAAELDKQQKTLATLTGETEKNTTAQAANNAAQAVGGQTKAQLAEWDKYVAKLTETRDLLGANTAAEAAYTAAKMGATAEQKAQAKVIADQTDTLKKYQDAIKENDKVQKVALRAQLVALYTQQQAAEDAAAAVKKAHEDAAKAAKDSADSQILDMQRVIDKAVNLTKGRNLLLLPEQPSDKKNHTGYGLLTNGGTAPVPASPVVTRQSADALADAAIAQLEQTTEANKRVDKSANEAARALKAQAKALEELLSKSGISTQAANAMADAYLSGADNVRALTIQQEIEQELLKTGADARDKVTAAINALHDAEDRRDVAKTIASMKMEIQQTEAQAKATLQGTAAIEAFNVEKTVQAELVGKNIKAGSEEYKQLVATTKAQLEANKALERASKVESITDRLYPQTKLLRDYREEQAALNDAMALYPERAADYQAALVRLGAEYEANQRAASVWGQITEAGVERIDDAFADMWKSVLSKSGNFMDTLKNSFRQFLAEMLHLAITKPIIVQIGPALGVGGLAGQASGIFGGGSSGSGFDLQGAWNNVSGAYSVATSGFGQAVGAGWTAGEGFLGGVQGAFKAGAASISTGIGSLFAGSSGTMVNGVYQLGSSAAPATVDLISNTVSNSATGAVSGTASGATTAAGAGLSATSVVIAGIGGAIQGYLKAGVKGAVAGAGGAVAGAYAGAAIGSMVPVIGTAIGGAIGAVLGGMFGSSLFGGSWVTKDTGFQLGVEGGDFESYAFDYQKKKGGLFSSNKKRTRLTALDPEMQAALDQTYATTLGTVVGLFDSLNVELNDGVLDGLNIAATKISTKDKTAEEIQEEITKWFTGLGDAAVAEVNKVTSSGLDGFNLESLTTFVNNLYSVNSSLDMIGVRMVGFNVAGGRAIENLIALSGGLETLNSNITKFYDGFTTDLQKSIDTLDGVRAQFAAMGLTLPATRAAFAEAVKGLDMTSAAERQIFASMTANAEQAAAAYSILEQRQSAYYSAFYSEAENNQRAIDETTASLKAMGITLPATRDAFRAMVEAASKDTSAAGKALYDSLMSVAGAAGSAFDLMEASAQAAAQAAEAIAQAQAEAQANYYSLFTSEAQKSADTLAAFTEQMRALGLAVPDSRNGFVALIGSIDKTTASGLALFHSLMGIASSADAAFKVVAEALNAAFNSSFKAVQRAISAEKDARTAAYNAQAASLNDMLSSARSRVSELTAVSTSLEGALKALRGTSEDTVKMLRAQAVATLQSALSKARAGGSLAGFAGLEDALDVVSSNSTDLYGSMEDFARDQGRTANVVAQLNAINGKQLTSAEKSVAALEKQIEAAKKSYDLQMAQYDDQLAYAQSQLDALSGIDNSVMSVAAAMQQMNTSIVAALSGQAAGAGQANTTGNNVELIRAVYKSVLGRDLDGNGLASWTAALANGSVTYDNLVESIIAAGRITGENIKVPGFAAGGSFGGGLRLVGENGPELEVTGPSRIYNANQTAAMLNGEAGNASVAAELRALRAELASIKANTQASAQSGAKLLRTVDRVTDGGNAMLTKELA